MTDVDDIITFLDKAGAIQLGESPWRSYEPEDELHLLDWDTLFRPLVDGERWNPEQSDNDGFGRLVDDLRNSLPNNNNLNAAGSRVELNSEVKPSGWDTCAWYQPIHFFGYDWGIFIRQDCVKQQAKQILEFIKKRPISLSGWISLAKSLIRASVAILFLHEHYHHKVECLGLRFHVVDRRASYTNYYRNVYEKCLHNDEQLEEALANADIYNRLTDSPYSKSLGTDVVHAARNYLKWRFPHDPLGYRKAIVYLKQDQFDRGENLLHSRVHEAVLKPVQPSEEWNLAPRLMQSFFSIKSRIWSVVPKGSRSILPCSHPVRTCSTAEMVRLLKYYGYREVPGGKGSHIKLDKKGSRPMIVPGGRRELSVGAAENALKDLGPYNISSLPDLLKRIR